MTAYTVVTLYKLLLVATLLNSVHLILFTGKHISMSLIVTVMKLKTWMIGWQALNT